MADHAVSIHGNFAIHRTKSASGRDAIILIPEPAAPPLLYSHGDDDVFATVLFADVAGGRDVPDSYLTLSYENGNKVFLGPDIAVSDWGKN